MSHEEVESQLSAMFDGELPAEECELLSRRLGRDDLLRARWSRYAVIGAAMRSEPVSGASLQFARSVSERLAAEASGKAQRVPGKRVGRRMLWNTAVGSGLVAAVAGVAVLMLRADMTGRGGSEDLQSIVVASQRFELPQGYAQRYSERGAQGGTAVGYELSPAASGGSVALPAQLANYVVAHSEYSSPLARRGLLSALVSSDEAVAVENSEARNAEGYAVR
ncbi:MAG: sigma-E factor negative regulatory protein [Steroidobacteraceae bacterium]